MLTSRFIHMPNARTHDAITYAIIPFTFLAAEMYWGDHTTSIIATVAMLFSGLMFGPDLDLDSKPYRRWGPLKFLWKPYQAALLAPFGAFARPDPRHDHPHSLFSDRLFAVRRDRALHQASLRQRRGDHLARRIQCGSSPIIFISSAIPKISICGAASQGCGLGLWRTRRRTSSGRRSSVRRRR